MKKEYKYLIISGTLGLIEGGSDGLRDCLIRRWKLLYPDIEAEIKVNLDSVKYITEGQYKGCAMPKMTVSLTVDNESYSFVRDWEREQLLNNVKPEYHNDDDFFESDKSQSYIDYQNALKEIGMTQEEVDRHYHEQHEKNKKPQ